MSIAVTDRITRGADNIAPFAIVWEEDIKLSNITVDSLSERDAIPEWKRMSKMTCFVRDNNTEYRLGTNVTIAGQVWTANTYGVPDDVVTEEELFTDDGFIKAELIQNIFLNSSFVVGSQAAMLALTTLTGNFIIRTDTSGIFVKLNNDDPAALDDFAEITYPGAVLSVNGYTGTVVISLADLITGHEAAFNTFISNSTIIGTIQDDISDLEAAIAGFDLSNKADLVGGTVPLAQLPYVFSNGITRTTANVEGGGNLTKDTDYDGTTLFGTQFLNHAHFRIEVAEEFQLDYDDNLVSYTLVSDDQGLRYTTDIMSIATAYTLVHKQYTDQHVLGTTLTDPNNDRLLFWDDSAGAMAWLTLGTNLSITGTTLNATGGGGGGTITGSGVAERLTFWTGTTSIDDDSTLLFNSTAKILTSNRFNSSLAIVPSTTVTDGDLYYDSVYLDYRIRSNGQWTGVTRPEIVIDNSSTTVNLNEGHRNKILYLGAATDITVNAGNISVGFVVTIYKAGLGDVIFNATGGTTLDAVDNTILTQDTGAVFVQKSTTKWSGAGSLGAGDSLTSGSGITVTGGNVNLGGYLSGGGASLQFATGSDLLSLTDDESNPLLFIIKNGIALNTTGAQIGLGTSAGNLSGTFFIDDTLKISDSIVKFTRLDHVQSPEMHAYSLDASTPDPDGFSLAIKSAVVSSPVGAILLGNKNTFTSLVYSTSHVLIKDVYTSSSGSNSFAALEINSTITQTGSATGTVYGIKHRPTINSLLGTHYFLDSNAGIVKIATPTQNDSNSRVLTINSTTNHIEWRAASSLGGGGGSGGWSTDSGVTTFTDSPTIDANNNSLTFDSILDWTVGADTISITSQSLDFNIADISMIGTSSLTLSSSNTIDLFVGTRYLLIDNTGIKLNLTSDATGDTYYRNSSGYLTRVAAGTNSYVYTMVAGVPAWSVGPTIATSSDLNTGTDNVKFLTSSALKGSKYHIDSASMSTSGSTITLDMNNQIQRILTGSASFAVAKTIALSNTTNALAFSFHFQISNIAAALTLFGSATMSDANWNTSTNVWTPTATGKYEMAATYDNAEWKVKIMGPFV